MYEQFILIFTLIIENIQKQTTRAYLLKRNNIQLQMTCSQEYIDVLKNIIF